MKFIFTQSDPTFVDDDQALLITCPDHGAFIETATRHLDGHGCPICDGKQYVPLNVCRALAECFRLNGGGE